LIIALVDMGRKKEVVNMTEASSKRSGGSGRLEGFDSVYAIGQGKSENKQPGTVSVDEFLVYDPSSIKRFIVCL
jgi:hypothetical protein